MTAATLTADGRIVVPREVRDSLGLRAGDRLAFRLRADGVVEMEPETENLMSLCESIKPRGRHVSIEDMNDTIRKAASDT